ncbi:MAG: hypothetical protein AAF225_00765 [Pseudomonadota bacterium]
MLSVLLTAALTLQSPIDDSAVLGCIAIERDKRRLACYDEALGRLDLLAAAEREAEALAAQSAAATVLAAEQARIEALEAELLLAQQRAADAELRASRADARAKEATRGFETFTAEVREVSVSPYGKLTLQLSNGETWRQLESDSTSFNKRRTDQIQTVEVRAAALGSRRMSIEPIGKTIRVKRVDDE